jgi:hypothetical protein
MTNPVFADGIKMPKEKWFEPDAGTLSELLSQEHIDEVKNLPDERKSCCGTGSGRRSKS